MKRLLLISWLGLFAGCAEKEPPQFALVVRAESDPGQPLARVKLLRDGALLAETDAQGSTPLSLRGGAGDTVALQVQCPEGFRSPEQPLSVALRPLLEQDVKPEYQVRCAPLERSVVVAVRAQNGPNLPVTYLGKEIARTDAAGACHALLKAAPGESITLTLDTSAPENAGLMPQNPELKLTVPERDELLVFDQSFTRKAEKKKPVQRAPRARGPVKL